MRIETKRFGVVTVEPNDIITVQGGLIGLPHMNRFAVLEHIETGGFRWWLAVDDPETAFVTLDPGLAVPDYDLSGLDAELAEVGLGPSDARQVVVLATVSGATLESTTLNLAAPIVVNPSTRVGRQVVVPEGRYPVSARLDDLVSAKPSLELAA